MGDGPVQAGKEALVGGRWGAKSESEKQKGPGAQAKTKPAFDTVFLS